MNLKELKIRAKELEMKKYHSMNKKELIEAIEKAEELKLEKEKWIEYILKEGEKKYKVSRGFAQHVDNCPINVRVFKGKSYANITDNCDGCKFELGVSALLGCFDHPEQYIICGGGKKIKNKDYSIRLPFDEKKYIEEKIKIHKHIYSCEECHTHYFGDEIFKCDYTDKTELSSYFCNNCGSKKLIKHQNLERVDNK